MISRPSPAELLTSVRAELQERIAPELSSPQAHAALAMIQAVLGHVQVMVDGEMAWIREELDTIIETAQSVIAHGGDENGRIEDALALATSSQSSGWDIKAARNDYNNVSELLSRCLEAGVQHGGDVQATALAALSQRIDRQIQIRGALMFASRIDSQEKS